MVYNRNDCNHWIDADNRCMNTRHETLVLQADGPVNLSPNDCFVSSGLWPNPFSNFNTR